MSKAPKCKQCGHAHWGLAHIYYGEKPAETTRVRSATALEAPSVAEVQRQKEETFVTLAAPVTKPVTKPMGRPRRYQTNAERQRAYRERVSLHWNGTE